MHRQATLLVTALITSLFGLSGCAAPRYSDAPTPTRFAVSQQQALQAAAHWQAIADNMAEQISADLKNKGQARILYVKVTDQETAFVDGFRELLTTALVNQGWDLSTSPKGALTVEVRYSAQTFRPERVQNVYHYGDATALVAGLWAVAGIADSGLSRGAKLLAATAGAEGFAWFRNESTEGGHMNKVIDGPIPQTEIILTAQVLDNDRILARRTNLYYAIDKDIGLYWKRTASTSTTLQVKGE